jgi:hypothetical protein
MSRYQALRRIGCDPLTAGFIAAMNWAMGQPKGQIRFMHITMEYDTQGTPE